MQHLAEPMGDRRIDQYKPILMPSLQLC